MVTFTDHPGFNNRDFVAPEGFPFSTNHGLHPDRGLLFFETGECQFTFDGVRVTDHDVIFTYREYDSHEGEVQVVFTPHHGSTRDVPEGDAEYADVGVVTGSDVWDIEQTAAAVSEALALHRALMNAGLLPYKFAR